MNGSLYPYERHVASFLIALFFFLGLISSDTGKKTVEREMISVQVVGAVRSQVVRVPKGSTVDEVLALLDDLDQADFQEIDGMKRLIEDSIIVVPYRDRLTLFIRGAVLEERVVVVERGAQAEEILQHVEPLEDADLQRFLRRKTFINGSIVDIFQRKRSAIRGRKRGKDTYNRCKVTSPSP